MFATRLLQKRGEGEGGGQKSVRCSGVHEATASSGATYLVSWETCERSTDPARLAAGLASSPDGHPRTEALSGEKKKKQQHPGQNPINKITARNWETEMKLGLDAGRRVSTG